MIIINIIVLSGRLTKDPEIKKGNNKTYGRFTLAVNRPFKKDETDFVNCVAFSKTAELIGEYCRKGHRLSIVGRLQQNNYEINGEKRTSYDVIVDSMEFLENRNSNNGPAKATKENVQSYFEDTDSSSDEFPF